MFRTTDVVLIAVMVSAAAFTYKTKHEAENWLSQVQRIEREIQFEKDSIDVLKADWSLLTQPARLQKLVEVYAEELKLEPVGPRQIVELDELPARPLTIEDLAAQPMAGTRTGPTDPVTTGGVAQ